VSRVIHIIGNGDSCHLYRVQERQGLKLTCNLAPFPVSGVYATTIVDFKMMKAIQSGEVQVPGYWIVGMRPKMHMDQQPGFYMKVAKQVKDFYTVLPKYCPNYTDFNCGHFAAHYAANKFKADEIHMYGFDSIFDFNLRSTSDFILFSDRDNMNTNRLATNWRPVWRGIFNEFPNTKFVLHHFHNNYKIPVPDNVSTVLYSKDDMKNLK
tara:strand:- start:151 stop:777 length:627 start_codon:yes stop_codon:yes gene_type:complete